MLQPSYTTPHRAHYNQLLAELRNNLLGLGQAVEQSFARAIESLYERDTAKACEVIAYDLYIDAAHRALETDVIRLLATQQPIVGADLRLLMVAAAVATELERIGDYACGIARCICRKPDQLPQFVLPANLMQVVALMQQMLTTSLQALAKQDTVLAQSLVQIHSELDTLRQALRLQLMALARANVQYLEVILEVLHIIRHLERVAHRATNIGERVIYLVTSKVEGMSS
ncbi:MAG: phosphate signaling complex protein PhoU [Chloroflexaceae bacterium]|nr:phosphate signaling complex protein PhoU [Chloroflexaceae bacterium]